MGCVESDSILRRYLRVLRRIEFFEKDRKTSLEADPRALGRFYAVSVFYAQNA
jgi:hypothetical protein